MYWLLNRCVYFYQQKRDLPNAGEFVGNPRFLRAVVSGVLFCFYSFRIVDIFHSVAMSQPERFHLRDEPSSSSDEDGPVFRRGRRATSAAGPSGRAAVGDERIVDAFESGVGGKRQSSVVKPFEAEGIKSTITGSRLSALINEYQFPGDLHYRVPRDTDRACAPGRGEVAVYEAALAGGLRFPLPSFVRQVLAHLGLSVGQIAPNGWRILLGAFIFWGAATNKELSPSVFLHLYKVSERGTGWWYFSARKPEFNFVTNLPTSNRGWKDKYFFIRGSTWEFQHFEESDARVHTVPKVWGRPTEQGMFCLFILTLNSVFRPFRFVGCLTPFLLSFSCFHSPARNLPVLSASERELLKAAKKHEVRDWKLLVTAENLAGYLLGPEPTTQALQAERERSEFGFLAMLRVVCFILIANERCFLFLFLTDNTQSGEDMSAFDKSFLKKAGRSAVEAQKGKSSTDRPAKRPRPTVTSDAPRSGVSDVPPPPLTSVPAVGVSPPEEGIPGTSSLPLHLLEAGEPSRQPILTDPLVAWQKMLAGLAEEDLQALRGSSSSALAQGINHELAIAAVKAYMLVRRVAHTEQSLLQERESLKRAKTEAETAKANEAIALAERAEIIEHEKRMIEENKKLKGERAAVWAQHEADTREIISLREQLQTAKKAAVEEFRQSDEFQSLLMPVYLDGFSTAQKKIAGLFPELKEKIEAVDPMEEDEPAAAEEGADGGVGEGGGEGVGQTKESAPVGQSDQVEEDQAET